MLNVSEQRLRSWERQGLIPASDTFSFSDLIALRALQKLSERHIPSKQIGRAIDSLKQKLSHIQEPLQELRIISDGKIIAVQVAGQKMEAISGQLLFDFEASEVAQVKTLPVSNPEAEPAANRTEAEHWFQKGLELEETGSPIETAAEAYRKAVELNPMAAGALVNLGTIAFRAKRLREAAVYYQRAIEADPQYPLAHFNLANVFDELGQSDIAREHYELALHLNPEYADAHFNLALIAERAGKSMAAVRHWKAYLKLDPTSQWAEQARKQLERLRKLTVIE
jgi:tetratricopeptide (TPR) repeat protein